MSKPNQPTSTPLDEQQQKLHDDMLTALFQLYDVRLIGMNLHTATEAVLNFASYCVVESHFETKHMDLLRPEKEGAALAAKMRALIRHKMEKVTA